MGIHPFSQIVIFPILLFLLVLETFGQSLDSADISNLNNLFGIQIIDDRGGVSLDRGSSRLLPGWNPEWQWGNTIVYRSYPQGAQTSLGGRVYSRSARFEQGSLSELSIVFSNRGDTPSNRAAGLDVDMAIREDAKTIEKRLKELLGEGSPHLDKTSGLPESGRIWKVGDLSVFLANQPRVYARLKVFPSGGGERVADAVLRDRNIQAVERRANGDVVISGFPMIDQGPKGYCVPASWARVLQFMGVRADMYVLGAASNSEMGGTDIYEAARIGVEVARSGGRRVDFPQLQPTVKEVARYINKGIPIIWGMAHSEGFAGSGRRISGESRSREKVGGRGSGFPHMCIIIGYNEATEELAVSDSWGIGYGERWYDIKTVKDASLGKFYVVEY
jgi:hypothetical protein